MEYSKDTKTFKRLVSPYMDGETMWFSGIPYTVLAELLKRGMLDPQEEQNGPPIMQHYVDFLFVNPGFTVGGYHIRNQFGEENGIIIESIEFKGEVTLEILLAFIKFAQGMDLIEATTERLYAWND